MQLHELLYDAQRRLERKGFRHGLGPSELISALVQSNGGRLRLSPVVFYAQRFPEVFAAQDPLCGDTVLATERSVPPDAVKGWRHIFRGAEGHDSRH